MSLNGQTRSVATSRRALAPAVVNRALEWMFAVATIGLAAELLLSTHYEDVWQWIPLVLLGLIGPARVAVRPDGRGLILWQALMGLIMASGLLGIGLHLKGKAEFVLERAPDLNGVALLLESLKGASPPILAPGAMLLLGAIGLLWSMSRPPAR